MKSHETNIWVYAHWESFEEPHLLGILTSQRVRGKEVFSFEYDEEWLSVSHQSLFLDPELGLYKGKQYQPG
ncbi:MAG: type II toxin-antitoxin system HipA family toxin, partial [Flavobacteriales bacterium]